MKMTKEQFMKQYLKDLEKKDKQKKRIANDYQYDVIRSKIESRRK